MRTESEKYQSDSLVHHDRPCERPFPRIATPCVHRKDLSRPSKAGHGKHSEHELMLTPSQGISFRRASRVGRSYSRSEQAAAAEMVAKLSNGDDVRKGKVMAIRAQISAGTYDDALKLEIAVDRLLEALSREL